MAHPNIVDVNESNFEAEVLKSDKPVLLDFWAEWCGPCRILGPVVDRLAASRDDIKIVKVDVDMNGPLSMKFNVRSIPTLVVMDKGQVIARNTGFLNDQALKDFVNQSLQKASGSNINHGSNKPSGNSPKL